MKSVSHASLRRVFASSKFRRARSDFTAEEIAGVQRTAELGALEQVAQLDGWLGGDQASLAER